MVFEQRRLKASTLALGCILFLSMSLFANASSCTSNLDCKGRSWCSNTTGECYTPSLSEGGDARDVAAAVACFLGAALAAGAGLGGGGMFVPFLILIGGFSTNEVFILSILFCMPLYPNLGYPGRSTFAISHGWKRVNEPTHFTAAPP